MDFRFFTDCKQL